MASEHELRSIAEDAAEQAADKAIERTFGLLGVDITNQDHVNEFRADLIYARSLRRMSERVWGKAVLVVVTAGIAWGLVVFGTGLKTKLGL